jgi:BirA family transcriptional regulator, biotin operon repressor / biotin---[acetyl-CoA-carboxylase] ligase
LRSDPPDRGGSEHPQPIPLELASALGRERPRLGRLASTLLYFDTIGSTNDVAMARLVEGLVVVADEQTAGRGRRGHTWFSPPGSGLYVSAVLSPATSPVDPLRATTLLTLAVGVAIAEGIEEASGLRVDLKWPNDLHVSRRKLGGILAESSGAGTHDAVVVGYGLNVLSTAFPQELGDRATSLETELGRAVDRHDLLAATLAALSRRYDDLLAGRFDAILDAWRRRAPGAVGARVTWTTNGSASSGVTAGIDDLGALLVRVDDRIERVVSGEVTWL